MQSHVLGVSRCACPQRQRQSSREGLKTVRAPAPRQSALAHPTHSVRHRAPTRARVIAALGVPSGSVRHLSSPGADLQLDDSPAPRRRLSVLRLGAGAALCVLVFALSSTAAFAATADASSGVFAYLVSFILHLDKHLNAIVAEHGARTYAILFAIVFAETGLVVTPFLPGDSLLFAAGALCAMGSLNLFTLIGLLFVAAVLGDTVNYAIGKKLGSAVFTADSKIFRREYVKKTEEYFAKHGAKTIVLARFVPIVRTFAPFIAGVGTMAYSTFVLYNVVGAAIWTGVFSTAGYLFGGLPFVQKNFTLVVLAIVVVSVVPVVIEILQARKEAAAEEAK